MLPYELIDKEYLPIRGLVIKGTPPELRIKRIWTCARCQYSVTSPSQKRLRDLARRHAASHARAGA